MAATHDRKIETRVAGSLIERVRRSANERGMSLSEFMRDAMRRSLEAA